MRKKLALVILVDLALVAAACSSPGQANVEERRSVRARTEVIQLNTVSDEFQAPGTIRAKTSTALSSRVVGQILSLKVREGDRVQQGQLLAEIDNREASSQLRRTRAAAVEAQRGLDEADRSIKAAEAAVRAAEANRDLAASTQKRYEILRERHSVSPQEYDEVATKYKAAALETERAEENLAVANARRLQITARIEQAEAEVDGAQVASGHSNILSPLDGIVTARQAEPGMLATPGMPILSIEDDRTYELEAAVEESRAATIAIGQSARVEIDALQGATFPVKVREIVPSSDPATRTYTVKLQLASLPHGHTLRSGFFGRAFFSTGERKAILIPEAALTRRGQLDGVYIVENDHAILRLVKTGKRYGQRIEILSGLASGARIVVAPAAGITDGVKIVDEQPSRNLP